MIKTPKEERQDTIAKILSTEIIESQEEMLRMLIARGYELTQATLSRDFKELKIAKTPDASGRYYYQMPRITLPQQKPIRHGITSSFTRQGIINIDFSDQFAVIKTPEGYANGIARDIDINNIHGVMGTIAGNDTVLVIFRENSNKENLIASLKILFDNK